MEQSLNLYQIFYEVAHCRNFSVAARKLYISQPAISKSIAKLEENLGVPLFHRSSRGVTLTSEGELLFKHVEKAILSLQTGEDELKSILSEGSTTLSIGVSTTLCKYVLLPLLKNFILENSNIKIAISCQSTFETITDLSKNLIEIGLVGIPQNVPSDISAVSFLPISTIEDTFVATDAYLAPFVNENMLEDASFIMLDKENISRKHADTFLTENQINLKNMIEVNNMDLSIDFAKAGLGIACVIREFVSEDIKNGTLRELKFRHKIPKRQIGFAYPANIPMTGAMNTLIQYYQTYF